MKVLLGLLTLVLANCSTLSPPTRFVAKQEKAMLFLELASATLLEGDPTSALGTLETAEALDPGLAEIHHLKALCYHAKHRKNLALASARKAVRLSPKRSEFSTTLGRLLSDAGERQEARTYLKAAAEDVLYYDAYKAWTSLGLLSLAEKNAHAALEELGTAIQENPERACIAYYERGKLKKEQKHLQAALQDFVSASTRFCIQFHEAKLERAKTEQALGHLIQARKLFLELHDSPKSEIAKEASLALQSLH
jgi:Tfp pilus assembly protein PilF